MSEEMKKILLKMLLMVLIFIFSLLGIDAINSKISKDIEPIKEAYKQNEQQIINSSTEPALNP